MILALLLAALWAIPAFAIPLALIVAAELMCRAGDREREAADFKEWERQIAAERSEA